jgi:hypothetical protein
MKYQIIETHWQQEFQKMLNSKVEEGYSLVEAGRSGSSNSNWWAIMQKEDGPE